MEIRGLKDLVTDLTVRAAELETSEQAEKALELLLMMAFVKKTIRETEPIVNDVLVSYMEQHGDLEDGENRWYPGIIKTTRCKDTGKTAEAVLEAVRGDLEAFLSSLVSQPFKHGHLRSVLPETIWNECFETEVRKEIKTGKPKKRPMLATQYTVRRG